MTIEVFDPFITTTAMVTGSAVGQEAVDCAVSGTTVVVAAGPIGPQIVDLFHSESTETSLAIGSYLDDSLLSCLGSCLGSHLHLISLHRFFASSVTKFR